MTWPLRCLRCGGRMYMARDPLPELTCYLCAETTQMHRLDQEVAAVRLLCHPAETRDRVRFAILRMYRNNRGRVPTVRLKEQNRKRVDPGSTAARLALATEA